MILEFTKGYKRVNDIELNKIKDIIQSSYPKAIVRIVTERHTYAPELNKSFISVSAKL